MNYLRNTGLALDRFLNCLLLAGDPADTVSVHAAHEQANGRRWACVLCKWLSMTVERDHCTKTLADDVPTKTAASVRGLAQMILVVVVLYVISLQVWQ